MRDTRLQFILFFALSVLLVVLAVFQYKWVGQISEAEQERLQKRLMIDSQHFADDFNRLLQTAYFTFQISGENWQNEFLQKQQIWQQNAKYPQLIKQFKVVLANEQIAYFDPQTIQFVPMAAKSNFGNTQKGFELFDEKELTLTMPIYDQMNRFTIVKRNYEGVEPQITHPNVFSMPSTIGYLIIELDEKIIKEQILPDLSKRYFPEGDYKLSIFSKKQNSALFQTEMIENPDATVSLFELLPDNLRFFVNQNLWSELSDFRERREFFLNKQVNRVGTTKNPSEADPQLNIRIFGGNNQILDKKNLQSGGGWTLNVRHRDGSLQNFVSSSRRQNLLVSFGILGLLSGSIGLIFLSARRAQVLAQRQLDFVSAVSHEFRTPIAVIYSAGENLADGVAREGQQVSRYGNLIKGEGKKLAGMVEQILEFAGARSGRRKYDFRETEVREILETALNDCAPLIAEKKIEVETDFQENLPLIQADINSLSHAVQNLIINAIKYSNGANWLKISGENDGNEVKITVEDRGIGIARKDLKQIFSPFYRAKEVVDAQIHGNGLGLSLVKQTIDAHQGKIEVESEPGKGSKFILRLPTNF